MMYATVKIVLSGTWRSLVFFSSLSFIIIIAWHITVFVISMYTDFIKFLEFEDISFFYLPRGVPQGSAS